MPLGISRILSDVQILSINLDRNCRIRMVKKHYRLDGRKDPIAGGASTIEMIIAGGRFPFIG
jgi:hypothetical protein